ncbi:MAG: hypothetical protein NZ870_02115 [bacterium]|nr:hypothetical protein [bacterium]
MFVLSDDLTGACDCASGFGTKSQIVYIYPKLPGITKDVTYVVTKTRYLSSKLAVEVVKDVLKKIGDFDIIYKKIDSTLRGNIRSELKVFIDFYKIKKLPFIPAQPIFNRFIKNGSLYVGNKKLTNTQYIFDKKSAKTSEIKKILGKLIYKCEFYDVIDMKDFRFFGKYFAGSSILAYKLRNIEYANKKFSKILVINGSRNSVSLRQVEKIRGMFNLVEESSSIAHMKKLIEKALSSIYRLKPELILVIGGETSQKLLEALDISVLNGCGYIDDGAYLFKYKNRYFIFKPGGFGDENFLKRVLKKITI